MNVRYEIVAVYVRMLRILYCDTLLCKFTLDVSSVTLLYSFVYQNFPAIPVLVCSVKPQIQFFLAEKAGSTECDLYYLTGQMETIVSEALPTSLGLSTED